MAAEYKCYPANRNEQQKSILDMRRAIADYCEAARKITPEYHEQALNECLAEIVNQAVIDGFATK